MVIRHEVLDALQHEFVGLLVQGLVGHVVVQEAFVDDRGQDHRVASRDLVEVDLHEPFDIRIAQGRQKGALLLAFLPVANPVRLDLTIRQLEGAQLFPPKVVRQFEFEIQDVPVKGPPFPLIHAHGQ